MTTSVKVDWSWMQFQKFIKLYKCLNRMSWMHLCNYIELEKNANVLFLEIWIYLSDFLPKKNHAPAFINICTNVVNSLDKRVKSNQWNCDNELLITIYIQNGNDFIIQNVKYFLHHELDKVHKHWCVTHIRQIQGVGSKFLRSFTPIKKKKK